MAVGDQVYVTCFVNLYQFSVPPLYLIRIEAVQFFNSTDEGGIMGVESSVS
ncbi:hypothetical protein WH47_09741 [Habropoda laboriosa]|uniref:Uncharacterized protein n=1 Tax=Habropoda laboriosa TaxID=597456 RepID=A0A0L7QME2_9HYME|nr:hypothetical protein WH47_09741 [Habropoda laboriosa]